MYKPANCRIVIIDGQGGKMGRQLVELVLAAIPNADLTAVGTNSAATSNMLRGGASHGATGENAVIVACRRADIIAGPIGIVLADSLFGEITPKMAAAVGASEALKVLIPMNVCGARVAGAENIPLSELIERAASAVIAAEKEWRQS